MVRYEDTNVFVLKTGYYCLDDEMMKAKTDEAVEQIGEEWLLEQCKDLLKNKVPVLHFYTLGKPHIVYNVLKRLL